MSVLYLTLDKKWFDLVASGHKVEEYRVLKPHWISRLVWPEYRHLEKEQLKELIEKGVEVLKYPYYNAILFINGYDANRPRVMVELKKITIGPAKETWHPDYLDDVFILHLGKILKPKYYI
jgi:hypothetical protein